MKKILIVDDRAEIRKLLAITLGLDYEVQLADNGEQALDVIRETPPHAVFLDVMMPGLFDGFDVLREVKSDPKLANLKVVMVTAKGMDEDVMRGKMLGADAYFTKPFSPLKVIQWLESNLE